MTAKHHCWRTSGFPVTSGGAVLETWLNLFIYLFIFNWKKKQINRSEGNHSVNWLDLWQTTQELIKINREILKIIFGIWCGISVSTLGPLAEHSSCCNNAWIFRWGKKFRRQNDRTGVTQSLVLKGRLISCFPRSVHLDDWGGLKNSPRSLLSVYLSLKEEHFLTVLWLFKWCSVFFLRSNMPQYYYPLFYFPFSFFHVNDDTW